MKTAIIGGGNIGTQFAVHCAHKGHSVVVFTSKPRQWSDHVTIVNKKGETVLEGNIAVTDNMDDALSGVDLIFIAVPSFMANEIAQKVAKSLHENAYICLTPGTGGMECAFSILKTGKIFGLQRVPSVVRLTEYGHSVCATGYRELLHVAALDPKHSDECAELIEGIFDIPCAVIPNYLAITLTPSNPILHLSRLYNIFGSHSSGDKFDRNPLFYEEWDDDSSRLLFALDEEVQNICKALPQFDLSYVRSLKVHYESDTPQALTRKIRSIAGFKGIYSPMVKCGDGFVPDLSSRFFTADFPYGLSILIQIASMVGVATPNMDRVYDWYKEFSGKSGGFSYSDYQINDYKDFISFYSKTIR